MSIEGAVRKLEAGLKEDPRMERVGGEEGPRDYLFTRRVLHWIHRLETQPSEALLLAAWGHDLYRWRLSRDSQPKTTTGYHKWRRAQSKLSADEVCKILTEEAVDSATMQKVCDLILKTNFPNDPDSRVLEDADCLAFIELKFESYAPEWEEEKTIRILKGTLEKMTDRAKDLAKWISLNDEAKRLLIKSLT